MHPANFSNPLEVVEEDMETLKMLRSLVSENVSRISLVCVFWLSMRNYARQNKIPVLLVFTKDDKAGHKSSRWAVEPFLEEGQVFQICNYFEML